MHIATASPHLYLWPDFIYRTDALILDAPVRRVALRVPGTDARMRSNISKIRQNAHRLATVKRKKLAIR
jgi:hypothetical protein